ncbi:helix-turn-helix transcriptional regulator [Nocardiopsis sp. CNT-189]|uniref:helix-turn-helix transcriptional regulator n=1 Tax=Nocardiopsis oceanisediminis TaxID=2816862 RepID=UPI003B3412A3
MSTIFGHGRLRLYLLKLLDESPKHGYEIISLLRDRFMGVYSPSPGTVYPRLARLEEEGLVTHEEVNGRKVYRLTDRGREELHDRSSDLDDLERELTESVRDIARAVKEDVRDTISSLREELKFAAAGSRRARGAEQERTGEREEDEQEERTASGEEREQAGEHAGERCGRRGPRGFGGWWEKDWDRFGRWGAGWGGAWGRPGEHGERPEFDRALHDFTDRVRDVVREAGNVGESAARDLRRILDETIEVIRRDAAGWGPAPAPEESGDRGDTPASDRDGGEGPEGGRSEGPAGEKGGRPADSAGPSAHGPFAQPPADSDAGSDPWSTAIREDREERARSEEPEDRGPDTAAAPEKDEKEKGDGGTPS